MGEEPAYKTLADSGFTMIMGYLDGGFDAWKDAGLPMVKTKTAPMANLHDEGFFLTENLTETHTGQYVYLDVRPAEEWTQDGILKFARLIEMKNILRSDYVSMFQEYENKNEKSPVAKNTFYIQGGKAGRGVMVAS